MENYTLDFVYEILLSVYSKKGRMACTCCFVWLKAISVSSHLRHIISLEKSLMFISVHFKAVVSEPITVS